MDYSNAALMRFLDMMDSKGLAPANTVGGLKSAAGKILKDLSEQEDADVRKVDVETAIRRFNNKNPGVLSPSSLAEYQRRVSRVIEEFVQYTEDPAGFKPRGRAVTKRSDNGSRSKERRSPTAEEAKPDAEDRDESRPRHEPQPRLGLTLAYPIRDDFLAQVVIPRDMSVEEAKRLSAFIQTLARDFKPAE